VLCNALFVILPLRPARSFARYAALNSRSRKLHPRQNLFTQSLHRQQSLSTQNLRLHLQQNLFTQNLLLQQSLFTQNLLLQQNLHRSRPWPCVTPSARTAA